MESNYFFTMGKPKMTYITRGKTLLALKKIGEKKTIINKDDTTDHFTIAPRVEFELYQMRLQNQVLATLS